jgi:Tol biopolymer transport system component
MNNLTNSPDHDDRKPAWSPDGTKIAFSRGGNIFIMGVDGSNLVQLTTSSERGPSNQGPAWSPDGTRIAYSRSEAGGNRDINRIFVINADGSGEPKQLTNALPQSGLGIDLELAWSPDGTKIAFSSTPNDPNVRRNRDIFTVDVPLT